MSSGPAQRHLSSFRRLRACPRASCLIHNYEYPQPPARRTTHTPPVRASGKGRLDRPSQGVHTHTHALRHGRFKQICLALCIARALSRSSRFFSHGPMYHTASLHCTLLQRLASLSSTGGAHLHHAASHRAPRIHQRVRRRAPALRKAGSARWTLPLRTRIHYGAASIMRVSGLLHTSIARVPLPFTPARPALPIVSPPFAIWALFGCFSIYTNTLGARRGHWHSNIHGAHPDAWTSSAVTRVPVTMLLLCYWEFPTFG